jgi:DeoR family transcriptional regulator of aga operon
MNRHERLNALLEYLARHGSLEVHDVAGALRVSTATIRRDLDHLAAQQMLTRTRGGAVAGGISYDLPLRYKTARTATTKQRIGQAAATLVGPGCTVGLNGGTTSTEVARALATRADLCDSDGEPSVTVVTNAVNIANELTVRSHVKIVLTGGVARRQSYELIGPLAAKILAELTLDLAFIGVDAFDAGLGASARHEGEAAINALMVSRAKRVVVVTDSTKLGRRAFARICPVDQVHALITDTEAEEAALKPFQEAGVQLIRA